MKAISAKACSPEIATRVAQAKSLDLSPLACNQFLKLWSDHEGLVLDTFGPRLLMPGLVATMLIGELRTFLQEILWDEDVDALVQLLSTGGEPDRTVTANEELYQVGKGVFSLVTWLAEHGHRAPGEFELAEARWRERPAAVQEMADRLAAGESPLERHHRNAEVVNQQLALLHTRLNSRRRRELDRLTDLVRRYITLREDSKDLLMCGYDLLRDLALEAGRPLEVGRDIFYLTRDEVFGALRVGFAPYYPIEHRKTAYRVETCFVLPRVIDAAAIDTLGTAPDIAPNAAGYKALAVPSGQSRGPVRILHSPTEAGDSGRGYILVCPSTDPSWPPTWAACLRSFGRSI